VNPSEPRTNPSCQNEVSPLGLSASLEYGFE
jgi:hypothetical protein